MTLIELYALQFLMLVVSVNFLKVSIWKKEKYNKPWVLSIIDMKYILPWQHMSVCLVVSNTTQNVNKLIAIKFYGGVWGGTMKN